MATSPRRNMMSEVIVKASHLERINGVHGGSCVTQGITTKTKPTIYNYDRRLLKPRWDWMTGKEFLPQKNRKPTKNKVDLDPIEEVAIVWTRSCDGFHHGFHYVVLPTSSNMGFKRSWNHGKHEKTWQTWTPSEPVLAPNALRKENSSCSVVRTIIFAMPSNTWQKSFQRSLKIAFFAFNTYSITRYSD